MDDKLYHLWDILLKIFGLIGLAIGGIFSGYQYFRGLREQRESAARESRKPFLTEQLRLYLEAAQVTASIATGEDRTDPGRAAAEKQFWELYWGMLALVESPEVELAMVRFGEGLSVPDARLRSLSLDVAYACRRSIAAAWKVSLEDLTGKTP